MLVWERDWLPRRRDISGGQGEFKAGKEGWNEGGSHLRGRFVAVITILCVVRPSANVMSSRVMMAIMWQGQTQMGRGTYQYHTSDRAEQRSSMGADKADGWPVRWLLTHVAPRTKQCKRIRTDRLSS